MCEICCRYWRIICHFLHVCDGISLCSWEGVELWYRKLGFRFCLLQVCQMLRDAWKFTCDDWLHRYRCGASPLTFSQTVSLPAHLAGLPSHSPSTFLLFTLFSAFVPHIHKDTRFLLVRLLSHWKSLCHCSVCSVTGLLLWRRFLFQTEQGKDCMSWTSLTRSPHQTGSVWFGLLRSVSVRRPLRPLCTHVDLNQLHPTALWVCTHVWPLEGANVLNVNTSICVYLHRYLIYFLE